MKWLRLSGNLVCILVVLTMVASPGIVKAQGKNDEGTIFSFHFDEDADKEASDSSGNDNHGVLGGNKLPNWVDGPDPKFGSALEFFDGNFMEIPASPELDTGEEITFETWLNLNSLTASWSTIYNKNAQSNNAGFHWVYINQNGTLAYQYCNGVKYFAPAPEVDWEFGKWTHVAITHKIDGDDGGVIKWYIDGLEIHEEKHADKALSVVGGKASFGTYQGMVSIEKYALDGMIDEMRLSPWVKTEAEIAVSMNAFAVEPHEKLADTWGRIKLAN